MATPSPPDDRYSAEAGCAPVMLALALLVVGGLGILQGFGLGEYLGKALVSNWVIGVAGLAFFCGGLAILLPAMGAGRWANELIGWVILLAIAATFHHGVFASDLESWSGMSLGPLSAGEFVRIGVVTADLLIVFGWIVMRTPLIGGYPGALLAMMKAMEPGARTKAALAMLAAPLAFAILLHATGVLDRIGAAFGQLNVSNRGSATPPKPTRALKEFDGWWGDAHSIYGAGWVTRVIIRTDGNKEAWVRLWHSCPPNHCEEGEFKAKVRGRPPDYVEMLEIRRDEAGVTRTIELAPNASGPDWLIIVERRIRGRDWNTNQESGSGMKRVK